MRAFKKTLGLFLTLVFALMLANIQPITIKAEEYAYTIRISLGNNADAYFDSTYVAGLKSKYGKDKYLKDKDNKPKDRVDDSKSDVLTITGCVYGEELEFDLDSLIKIKANATTGEEKYYVSGLRVSGGNKLVQKKGESDKNLTVVKKPYIKVTGDETYVVAYGVGTVIPYTVKYVDEEGNALLEDDTLYAAKGEVVYVPAKHIDKYYPNAYYLTDSTGLKADTVFTFIYKKYSGSTKIIDETSYSSSTVYGDPTYEYQYRNNGTNTTQEGTTNNRGNGGNAGGGAGDADAGDGDNAGAGDDTTITDGETPLDVIDIGEEEVAKAGGTPEEHFVRNMIVGIIIAIIAVLTILIALFVAERKRRAQAVRTDKNDEE